MQTELNLLVVDWDFFFPNPTISANFHEFETPGLYLWDHKETPFHTSPLMWATRASGFLHYGLELPRVKGWEGFWDRFQFSEDGVVLTYGDSNLHAGRLFPSTFGLDEDWGVPDRWTTVSLYDAHHDCGYQGTGSYEKWEARGTLTCEDWMLNHHRHGSRLEVTYPAWRGAVEGIEPPPLVPVDRRVDDGTTPDRAYDAIYVCRSGAWVPPWCDEEFTAFLEAAPGMWHSLVPGEDDWEHPRPDVVAMAQETSEKRARADEMLARLRTQQGGQGEGQS
ncbi:hypothetical protein [Streptomyces longwoodensis]|uniref:hypothetical protein n=1 Tax=Streptomyces longwoodensis TaxID=68231 RepID=UPI0036FCACC9